MMSFPDPQPSELEVTRAISAARSQHPELAEVEPKRIRPEGAMAMRKTLVVEFVTR